MRINCVLRIGYRMGLSFDRLTYASEDGQMSATIISPTTPRITISAVVVPMGIIPFQYFYRVTIQYRGNFFIVSFASSLLFCLQAATCRHCFASDDCCAAQAWGIARFVNLWGSLATVFIILNCAGNAIMFWFMINLVVVARIFPRDP